MPKKRIAELHALERSPIAKKLWFFIHLRNLEVSWPYFRPFTPLKGLALATSCSATFWQLLLFGATFWQLLLFGATFWQLCHFEPLLILGANWLNFKQLMAIKKPYNTVKSCYAIYARKKISVLSTLCLPVPQLEYPHYEVSGSQIRPCFSKNGDKIVKRNKFPSRLLCLEWEWLFQNRRMHLRKTSWNTCKD